MVVPTWIEFIAARNGTSSAGSSSPVLEKCSNSSAKAMKRCRSLNPCGSMSVDSVFFSTGIGGGASGEAIPARRAVWPPPDERWMKRTRPCEEIAPDSPSPLLPGARQSKTARRHGLTDAAAMAAGRLPNGPAPRKTRGDHEMTTSFARKALLGTAIAASVGIGYAIGAQPHMSQSITLLQSARAELAAATPNKGGHREK